MATADPNKRHHGTCTVKREEDGTAPGSTLHLAKKPQQPRRHAQPREGEECESETLILERESTLPHVKLLFDNQTSQLVNTGQHWSTGQSQQSTLVKTEKIVK